MTRSMRLAMLGLLVALLFLGSLACGKAWVPPGAWLDGDPRWWIIVDLRLPRAVLALALGAVLGLSGAVLQGYLRNPLADPGVVGVSSAAALGAVAALVAGAAGGATVFAAAIAGAAAAMALLAALTWRSDSTVTFVLAGTVLASLAGALTAFLISVAPNPYAVAEIMDWLMGALTDRGWPDVALALPPMAVGAALLWRTAPALDALALGEVAAASLGIHAGRTRALVVAGTGLAVGAGVAATGVIGFVGLVVPHLLRPLFGHRPGALLLPSALGGAALLLAADSLVRLAPGAGEVRLGVAMAMIGAPFFLFLLLGARGSAWR
ncbi:iron ABC transporter permease [Sphingomonas sp. KR1UV-12]|uniref:Iron ABC transporter permease n=1 Tax=Sphingomonas aurea TaxID=3063994 RepID=A0ABT9EFS0_9SPHN|nr:iron ABC transporter permease [Sphingomonas sp. KR1UV-12]MDP1025729.1 iron ABC transporter permease [Sphingomonas sp. KR1UV-12]